MSLTPVPSKIERGTQIVYVPTHVQERYQGSDGLSTLVIEDKEIEGGFVTSDAQDKGVFCRYWSKYPKGELRTKANSELTPRNCLFLFVSCSSLHIEQALEQYC